MTFIEVMLCFNKNNIEETNMLKNINDNKNIAIKNK